MKLKTCVLVSFLILKLCTAAFNQDDYHIVHDRIFVENFNKSLVEDVQIVAYKYNDTLEMKAINISIIFLQEIKEKILITLQILKYVLDEYRPIPFNITVDLCEEYSKRGTINPFGIQTALDMSNFRGCPCLPKKRYHVENWLIEEEKSPPHLPPGRYSLKVYGTVLDDNIYFLEGSWFGQLVARKGGKKKRRRH